MQDRRVFKFKSKPKRWFCDDSGYFLTFSIYNKSKPLPETERDIIYQSIIFTAEKRNIWLSCFNVLPTHVHMLMRVADSSQLPIFINRIKSYTSAKIKQCRHCAEPIWQYGSYDHVIRNEAEWNNVFKYITYNPANHGLIQDHRRWKHLYISDK